MSDCCRSKAVNEATRMLAVLFNLTPTLFKRLGLLSVSCFSLNRLALAIATIGKKGRTGNQGTLYDITIAFKCDSDVAQGQLDAGGTCNYNLSF